jgi:DNA-binding response OmpR family regulator
MNQIGDSHRPATSSKVLVVDDDANVLDTFARMLLLRGHDVSMALTVEAALRELPNYQPDVVLLDLRMPGRDGIAFLRELRAREKQYHIPVAIITGEYFIEDTTARAIRELDADLYFKPVLLEELVDITEKLLRRAAARIPNE